MSNESTDGHIENSGDHSEASPVPNTGMVALGKQVEKDTIAPSPKDIVLQRLSPHSSWDKLNDAPSHDEPCPATQPAKRALPMAAIVAIAAVIGAAAGSAATFGVSHFTQPTVDVAAQSRTMESLIAKVNADIASVKTASTAQSQKLAKLSDTVEKLRAPETTGSIASPAAPAPAPMAQPNRLPIVDGWSLREVAGGAATILGRDGIYEVLVGDPLPGVGRVDAIRRQDGRWVVVTSRGLIVSR